MGEMFFPLVFAIFAAHRYVNPKRGEVVGDSFAGRKEGRSGERKPLEGGVW